MAPTKRALAASATTSFLLNYLAPSYTIFRSTFWTAVALYLTYAFVWATWSVVIYPRFVSPLRHLPEPPNSSFFMGHSRKIMDEPSGKPMQEWANTVPNDGLIRYRHWFNAERLLVTSPKTLGEVLVTKNYEFIKPPHFRTTLGRILGVGILLAEGDEHKIQRKNLMPAFAFRHVKDLYPVFWSKSKEMVDTITASLGEPSSTSEKPSNVIEVSSWTSRATLDIITLAGMGQDFGALQNPENRLNRVYKTIFNPPKSVRYFQMAGLFIPMWFLRRLPIKRNHDMQEASATIKEVCRDLIAGKRAKMEKGERTEVDILSVALESGGFTNEELVNQMMTFLVAGHETTSTSMTWAIYLLCKHPDVQRRLREEVTARLPSMRDPNAQITSADIDGCQYLLAVCNEVLRVWAPVALTMRVAANDATINEQFVPKGTLIVLSPWAVNNNKELWGPDAEEFKPERWLAEGQANKGGAESNYSFLTFIHGPRSCIGQKFAIAEFACLLAAWVGRFETEFEVADYVPEIKGGVTSKPKGGLSVKVNVNESW